MGPGYFPRILGILLIVPRRDHRVARHSTADGERDPGWKWRPTVVVLGSVVIFGMLIVTGWASRSRPYC